MKTIKASGKRCLALLLAVLLMVPAMSLPAFANVSLTTSYAQLVAMNYELSQAEEDLLNSGYLTSGSFSFTIPDEDDGLVTIDTENATITAAESQDGWIPTGAVITYGGGTLPVALAGTGGGTYVGTYDAEIVGNTFSASVTYALTTTVNAETQRNLLNAAGWLKQGVANLEAVSEQDGNLDVLEQAMPELVGLAENGISTPLGSVELDQAYKDAVESLDQQMTENGGSLSLSLMIRAYKESAKTAYLMTNGADMKAEIESLVVKVEEISNVLNTTLGTLSSLIQLGLVTEGQAEAIELLAGKAATLAEGLKKVNEEPWIAAGMGTDLVVETADYAALDTLVAALGDSTSVDEINETLNVLTTSIHANVDMYDVTVYVELWTVNKYNKVVQEATYSGNNQFTFAKGETEETILKAVEAKGTEDMAVSLFLNYAGVDVSVGYERTTTELDLGEDGLTEDITYTITYSPEYYEVSYGAGFEGKEAESLPYGYKLTLEPYSGEDQVYDYYVNGAYYPQGAVYTITSPVTITRTTGKPYTMTDLYTVVSKYGTEKEAAILTSGALLNNPVINVRYPDTDDDPDTDDGALVTVEDMTLTAKTYASDYEGLYWMPYSYVVGEETYYFNGETSVELTKIDYESIKVYYRLTLTNFEETAAQEALALAARLTAEAKTQQSALATLSTESMVSNLGMLNSSVLVVLKDLVETTTLNEDASKNVALKELFNEVLAGIKTNCLNTSNESKLAELVTAYNNSGKSLAYYYRNSASFINEVGTLGDYLNRMLAADENLTAEEKLAALTILIDAAPSSIIPDDKVEEYTEKLTVLQVRMSEIRAGLTAPNAAIDTSSTNLAKLVTALNKDGTVGTTEAGYPYLNTEKPFTLVGSGLVVLRVIVQYADKGSYADVTVGQNEPVTAADIETLKAAVSDVLTAMGISDSYWYGCEEYGDGEALNAWIGQSFSTSQTLTFTWVDIEHSYCDINGHTEQTVPGKAATCTEPGLTDGVKCSVCSEVLRAQEEIPANGHTEETIPGQAATCIRTGLTDGVMCSACNTTLTEQEEIPALDHDFTGEYEKDANGHWHVCTREGCNVTDGVKSHNYNTNNCAEDATCVDCGYKKKEADEHSWGDWEKVDDEYHKQTCDSCGEWETDKHVWDLSEHKDSTCQAEGYEKYTCRFCGAEKTETIEVKDHVWSDWGRRDDDYHSRYCSVGNHTETAEHTWDDGVETVTDVITYTCMGCGTTKMVVRDVTFKLEAGETVNTAIQPDKDGYVNLPAPEEDGYAGGYRYDYVITYSNGTTRSIAVTNNDGRAQEYTGQQGVTITKKLINENNEKLEKLLKEMGNPTAFTASGKTVTQDGYYTGISIKTDLSGMMNVAMALVTKSGYGNDVWLNGEQLINDDGDVSLLSLLRALMGADGYTSDELIDLCTGKNLTLLDTTLKLGDNAASLAAVPGINAAAAAATGHTLDFTLELTSSPAQLASVGAMLEKVQKYVVFEVKEGTSDNELAVDVLVNLPEKVYEIYVAALSLTGNVDITDVNAVEEAVAYAFLKDYMDVLLGEDVTTTTLANTAAKLGYTVDLTEYAKLFQGLKSKLDNGSKVTYGADGVSASVEFDHSQISKVVDLLNGIVDEETLSFLKNMIAECQEGATITVDLNASVTNYTDKNADTYIDTDPAFEAVVIDIAALKNSGVINKADVLDFVHAGKLSQRTAALNGYAVVMLQADVAGDLVIGGTTILDLNGKTVNGNIASTGTLYIIDSSMGTDACGSVTGTVTGSVVVVGGRYEKTLPAGTLKTNYVQSDNGTVQNKFYTISANKDGKITINLNADLLSGDIVPDSSAIKALALDLCGDLLVNYYTSAAMSMGDGMDIYTVELAKLLELYSGEDTASKAVNEVLAVFDCAGISKFINTLIADLTDFGAIAKSIKDNDVFATYNMTIHPWKVEAVYCENGDYIDVSIVANDSNKLSKTVSVSLKFEGQDTYLNEIKELASELDKVVESEIEINIDGPLTYSSKNVNVAGSAAVDMVIDLTGEDNAEYITIIGTALAYANVSNKAEIVGALNAGNLAAMKTAFDKVAIGDIIAALEAMSMNADFSKMASTAGVSVGVEEAKNLEATYHKLLVVIGELYERGNELLKQYAGYDLDNLSVMSAKMGSKETEYGIYKIAKENVSRSGATEVYNGYGVAYALTDLDVSLTLKIFVEAKAETYDYTVVAEYYTNGTKDGEMGIATVTDAAAMPGVDVITAQYAGAYTTYSGNTYSHTDTTLSGTIYTIRYDRTVTTPVDPDPVDPDPVDPDPVLPGVKDETGCCHAYHCPSSWYSDLDVNAWYHTDTDYVICKGLMIGVADGKFAPYMSVNRAMIVTTLYRLENCPEVAYSETYTDVPDGTWYTDAIMWATENGIVLGYGNGCYGPYDPVTREQIAAIFYRYAQYKGIDTTYSGDLSAFTDVDQVSSWAVEALTWAVDVEMIYGVSKTDKVLAPRNDTNRAAMAALLLRWSEKVN